MGFFFFVLLQFSKEVINLCLILIFGLGFFKCRAVFVSGYMQLKENFLACVSVERSGCGMVRLCDGVR